jgi:hypothetical protein
MLFALTLLACGSVEGTPVGAELFALDTTDHVPAQARDPADGTPVTHATTLEICNGDAAAELYTTAITDVDGGVWITGLKATLTKNMGWAIEGGPKSDPTTDGSEQTREIAFACKRTGPGETRNRMSVFRVRANGEATPLPE